MNQHEEIITKRFVYEKISKLENIIDEKDERIDDLVRKICKMEATIDTLDNCISDKSSILEEKISDLEKKMEESIINNLNDVRISTVERSVYVFEKRGVGSDFCDYCELEFKAGCEKDRKEKDAHLQICKMYIILEFF